MSKNNEYYDIGKIIQSGKSLFSNKKTSLWLGLIALAIILFMSSNIRVSNWDALTDQTTGQKLPLALDPLYFLRVSETIIESNRDLPAYDPLRSPLMDTPWHHEILPQVMVGLYDVANMFGTYTIQEVAIFSPVFFFIIGAIIFFFLIYVLSGRYSVAILATAILSFAPAYLYRTMAGFSDHEAIGMVALFSFFLVYAISLKHFEKSLKHAIGLSFLCSLMLAFMLATWGGALTFILTVTPFSFFLYWIFAKTGQIKTLTFYALLILFSFITPFFFGFSAFSIAQRFTQTYGLLVPFVLVFIIVDYFMTKARDTKKIKKIDLKKYRVISSFVVTVILGLIGLILVGRSPVRVFQEIWLRLINPFAGFQGVGRLGTTVAENSQPYLQNWIGQSGTIVFWLFLLGVVIAGIKFAWHFTSRKDRLLFATAWIVIVSGILFTRISPSSPLNGTNFMSQALYFLSILFFSITLFYISSRKFRKVDPITVLIVALFFFTLINGRTASRIFFLIAPFVSFSVVYALGELITYVSKSKEEVTKMISKVLIVIVLIGALFAVYQGHSTISQQAPFTGPSASNQWQTAMEWVRANTNEGDVFMHWWDYGYWVQSLGKRPTVTDGGHSGGDQAAHYIGRYVLTTPEPKSALSYMKTWNASYLLIDPTDLGKYPAYSSIGGGSKDPFDRRAAIPVIPLDPRQTTELSNRTQLVYSGGTVLFEDIEYQTEEERIFLPAGKAAIGGILMQLGTGYNVSQISQPEAVYIYNGKQVRIPLRYAQVGGDFIDFKTGIEATVKIIPSFSGQQVNQFGAAIYLSQKVSQGLFAQLYLLGDPQGNYPTISLAHSELDPLMKNLRNAGYNGDEFIYYQGFRGPIKMWSVDYPENTVTYPSFIEPLGGTYARFDEIFYGEQR